MSDTVDEARARLMHRAHAGVSEVTTITVTPREIDDLIETASKNRDGRANALREAAARYSRVANPAPDGQPRTLRDYLNRYDNPAVGLAAELMKKDSERKLMHAMLTEAGIASESRSGEGICLIGRLAVLVNLVKGAHT